MNNTTQLNFAKSGTKFYASFVSTLVLLLLLLTSSLSFGQTTVTIGGGASVTCPATPTATYTTPPTGVSFSNWSRGTGVTCGTATNALSGSGFNTATSAGGFTANAYYAITISAAATHNFTLNSVVWATQLSGTTNSCNFILKYSNNGGTVTDFAAAQSITSSGTATNLTFNAASTVTVAAGTSLVLYFVPYGATASGTTVRLANGSTISVTATAAGITSVASGDWNTGSTWSTGTVPTATDNVTIAATHTVSTATSLTRTGTTTVNGTFQLNAGGFASGTNFTYGAAGSLNFNNTSSYGVNSADVYWPTTSGPVNVSVLQGGLTLNSGANRTVTGVFQTAAGVTLSSATLTLNATCRINTGGFFNQAPTYGASSTLVYNIGAAYGRSNEWSATSGAGYPANVQISNPGTVTTLNMGTTAAQCSGNITVDASTVLNTTSGGLTVLGNVLVNGTISLGGDVTTAGNWTIGATATQTNNSKAVFFNAATGNQVITKTGAGTVFFDYLVINKAAGNVQLSSSPATAVTINTTAGDVLQLSNAGALDLNGQALTLANTNGNIAANAAGRSITSTVTGATLNITGNKFVTGAGTLSIGANVTTILTAGLDFGSAKTTINGTLQINTGGFANTNAPIYANTATLVYNGVTGYGVGNEWTGNATTAGTGNPQNVTLTTSSVNMPAAAARALAGTLTIGTGSTLTLGASVGGDLTIGGNFSNSGTFNANSRLTTFGGTTAQTLTGATTFDYLKLNNSTGLTLNNSIVVTTNLDLTSGKLTLGTNNLTLNSGASITNASATNYIVTSGTGRVVKAAVGNTAFTFPIGLNTTNYTPVAITNTTGTSDLSVNVGSTITNAASDATKIVTLQWSVTSSAATTATVTPTWVAANQAASFTNTGTGELGNYTTAYTTYPVTLNTTTTTATGVALQNGSNLIVVGNTNAVFAPPPANDICSNATTLTIGAAAVSGTLSGATTTSGNTFTYGSTKTDVWYKFTPTCSGNHTVTLTFTTGPDIDIDLFSTSCPTTGTAIATSHGSTTTETITSSLTGGTVYYIRVIDWSASSNSFNINVTSAVTPTFTLANTGTPATGNIVAGTSNAVLFGFGLTPNACTNSFNFTAANITLGGTATATEYSNFRIIVDANANGIADAAEIAAPIGTVATYSATLGFTVTGQTGLTAVTRYLLIADASALATVGRTLSATLTAANTTANVTVTGTATGNTMTLIGTPPALTAASGATVDNPFVITFTDNPTWRAAITSVTVGGTTLTAGYTVSAGQITFTPSASTPAALLQTAGTKTIAVNATNYGSTSVSQAIGYGVATKLGITTQPTAPASNGGTLATQPVLAIQDQYGNTVANATNTVNAAVGAGAYTLGGTLTLNGVSGVVTYSNLTASSAALVSGATITFTATGLTSVTSNTFTVPAPDYIIMNALGVAVTEDMSIGTSATASLPQGFKASTAVGSPSAPLWIDAANNISATTNRGGTLAAASTGATYNWANGDPTSSTERAIGFLTSGSYPTGTAANNVGLSILSKVRNNTTSTMNDITVSFDYEKYRTGTNVCNLTFFYSTNGTTWTAATTGNHTFSADANSTSVPAGAPVTVSKSVVLSGINLSAGSDIYFRWSYASGGSNAQGIGLDNFSIYGCRTLSASIQSNNSPICSGNTASFTVTGTNGATLNYTINSGATQNVVLTGGTATITVNGATSNQTLSLVSVSEGLCSASVTGTSTVTVNPNLPASVSTGATLTSICAGTSVTFTATPTNGGSAPTYQWTLNGANIPGETGVTFTSSTLMNGDQVAVVMVSNASPCLTGSPATSNTITMTVNPYITASVSIGASATTICAGTSVTFTATPTNGGAAPSYQWYVGATPVGTDSATYTSTTLANGDSVSVVLTSNATPCLAGSPATSNSISITVNPTLTASVSIAASATTICAGTSVTFTATPTNGGTTPSYQWYVGATPVGTDSATFTTSSLVDGDVVSVVLTSNATPCLTGSPATSNTLTITVTPNVTPTFTAVAPICSGSSLSALPTTSNNGYTGTWSPALNNTATTTYTFTPDAGQCATTTTLTITVGGVVTWNGTAWDNVTGPTSTDAVVFTGNYTVSSDLTACSVTVNGGVVTVDSGKNLYLSGSVTVTTGSLTFNSSANLMQSNPSAVNTGNIIVKRNSKPLMRLDYTAWSSPVAGQELYAFSPFTFANRFYVYDSPTNLYSNSIGATPLLNVTGTNTAGVNGTDTYHTQFATGRGYLIRVPYNHPTAPAVWTGSFTGVPNNGTQTFSLVTQTASTNGYNLVGNPYPSDLSIAQFAADNASNIEETLYFWRKTNNPNLASYCTWNTTTHSFTANVLANASLTPATTSHPLGVIGVGQGFIVQAKNGASSLVFNNGQRTVDSEDRFFRPGGSATAASTATIESHRIWLNMTGATDEFSQTLVGYFTDGTLALDATDSKFLNDGAIALNTKVGAETLVMQGRPVPFDAADVVPLNYKVTNAGTYTIAIDHADGLFAGGTQTVYIKDNNDGSYHDITTTPFVFTSAAGTFDTRFELVYQNLLSNDTNTFSANSINVIRQSNHDVVVNTSTATMSSVRIFDIRGRLLVEKKDINANETRINVGTTNQVLLVEVVTTEGYRAVRKVVN